MPTWKLLMPRPVVGLASASDIDRRWSPRARPGSRRSRARSRPSSAIWPRATGPTSPDVRGDASCLDSHESSSQIQALRLRRRMRSARRRYPHSGRTILPVSRRVQPSPGHQPLRVMLGEVPAGGRRRPCSCQSSPSHDRGAGPPATGCCAAARARGALPGWRGPLGRGPAGVTSGRAAAMAWLQDRHASMLERLRDVDQWQECRVASISCQRPLGERVAGTDQRRL